MKNLYWIIFGLLFYYFCFQIGYNFPKPIDISDRPTASWYRITYSWDYTEGK